MISATCEAHYLCHAEDILRFEETIQISQQSHRNGLTLALVVCKAACYIGKSRQETHESFDHCCEG